jgi:hypothetical protein
MKIPKFWSKGNAEGKTRDGRDASFSCWRSSDNSEADAHESALSAAKRILDALLAGKKLDRYAYGCLPLREEVINKVEDDHGNIVAVVTRNQYGSLVLNTEQVMFVDIDFPPVYTVEATKYFFARLFGLAKKTPEAKREEQARLSIELFLTANPSWNLRLYRTYAGLRAIATHDVFDPKSNATLDILRQMGSDPLYIRLCKAQECFRGRLTPKPWRCWCDVNKQKYPLEDAKAVEQYEQWKAKYDVCQREYATCRFVGQFGSGLIHPDVEQVIELHDWATRCNEPLALA